MTEPSPNSEALAERLERALDDAPFRARLVYSGNQLEQETVRQAASLIRSQAEALIEARKLVTRYAREAGEATGRLEMSEAAGIVEGWRERIEKAEGRLGRRPDPTDLFEALEEGLCEGTPVISLTAGHIWIDGETSFDARTVIERLLNPPPIPEPSALSQSKEADDGHDHG